MAQFRVVLGARSRSIFITEVAYVAAINAALRVRLRDLGLHPVTIVNEVRGDVDLARSDPNTPAITCRVVVDASSETEAAESAVDQVQNILSGPGWQIVEKPIDVAPTDYSRVLITDKQCQELFDKLIRSNQIEAALQVLRLDEEALQVFETAQGVLDATQHALSDVLTQVRGNDSGNLAL